jgi:hypothetical protein
VDEADLPVPSLGHVEHTVVVAPPAEDHVDLDRHEIRKSRNGRDSRSSVGVILR